jgi:predicted transposase/invertase (TIGR01784 family)
VLQVADFGLAKARLETESAALTGSGSSRGTPHSMSPEQRVNAKDVDHRADIYSLGAAVYHLLTGKVSFGRGANPIRPRAGEYNGEGPMTSWFAGDSTMVPGLDPKVDYAFKKVFGSEANTPVLLNLLEAVLKPGPGQRLIGLDILNPFNDKEALDDKLSILDIKARDQQGRLYNVEMQMLGTPIFPQRVLYYWAVLHGQQLREDPDYAALRATISISFVNSVLFPQVPDYHLDFQLRASRHPQLLFSTQQSMHVLELPKFRRTAQELADPLDVWCYFLVHGADLDTDNLPQALRVPAVQRALEVLNMLTQNDLERQRYEARLKDQRDRSSFLKYALEEAEKRRQEGLEQGRQEGQKEGQVDRIHLCQRLLKLPLTPPEELLTLSLADLRAKAESLEQQLGLAGP